MKIFNQDLFENTGTCEQFQQEGMRIPTVSLQGPVKIFYPAPPSPFRKLWEQGLPCKTMQPGIPMAY